MHRFIYNFNIVSQLLKYAIRLVVYQEKIISSQFSLGFLFSVEINDL